MVDFNKGQRVRIVAGSYKKYRNGNFLGMYGQVMFHV
jgi:hypothetical protein